MTHRTMSERISISSIFCLFFVTSVLFVLFCRFYFLAFARIPQATWYTVHLLSQNTIYIISKYHEQIPQNIPLENDNGFKPIVITKIEHVNHTFTSIHYMSLYAEAIWVFSIQHSGNWNILKAISTLFNYNIFL